MKYQIFSGGEYLGVISHTLRVTEVAGCTWCKDWTKRLFQAVINRHPVGLTIIPLGETKKSKLVTLADIAPRKVRKRGK